MSGPQTLVATLGGQPQVVTFALDLLLDSGHMITDVIVVHLHPASSRLLTALEKLQHEFCSGSRYQKFSLRARFLPIRRGKAPLSDIRSKADANAVWHTFRELFLALKSEHHTIHLSIAGGRRLLGYLAMSAALFHFDYSDTIWHLYTPEDTQAQVRDGQRMHPMPHDGARLVMVPFTPLGAEFPALALMASPDRPPNPSLPPLVSPRRPQTEEERRKCQEMWERLTPRQQQVLWLLAQGCALREVACHLHITPATAKSHKRAIADHVRAIWNLPPGTRVSVKMLRERFGPFCQYIHPP